MAASNKRIDAGFEPSEKSLVLDLYTRPNCSLCSTAKDVILKVQKEIPFTYREIDISEDPDLEERFGTDIPVIFICGRKAFKYRVDENRLRKSLRARRRSRRSDSKFFKA